jgi:hypothetical protein
MQQILISASYVSLVMLWPKTLEFGSNVILSKDSKEMIKPNNNVMKWSQIDRRIELCMRDIIILRFEFNL